MRIYLHIGPEHVGLNRLQRILAKKRNKLRRMGVLVPGDLGRHNHTRLYMAATDPDHVDPLRHSRGYQDPERQAVLRGAVISDLSRDIEQHQPESLILSAAQLGSSLHRVSELDRLKEMLSPLSSDIRIVAHVDEPARLLARHYAAQVLGGRSTPLDRDLALVDAEDWWQSCLATYVPPDPAAGWFAETQGAPFWLDFAALSAFWEGVFGQGTVSLRPYDPAHFASRAATEEIRAAFAIEENIGKADPDDPGAAPSAAWIARARQLNALILRFLADRPHPLPRPLWHQLLAEIHVPGEPIDPGTLASVSRRFQAVCADLVQAHPALGQGVFDPAPPAPDWREAEPGGGYRASQYLLAFLPRIEKATRKAPEHPSPAADRQAKAPDGGEFTGRTETPVASAMPPQVQDTYSMLKASRFAPHNRLGAVDEEALAAAYAPAPARILPSGSSGRVIVACMKDEAPYILEWVAYHRAIGVDSFLIYTNDCSDGTTEILERLQDLGIVQHRNNDRWTGKSPQQHALDLAAKEPVVRQSDWIIHIDVDEFINIRTGNGTLDDFFDAVPHATNVAMTWRLFGHNGVISVSDDLVIDQFDTCAPSYCPKPHTAWGFKTMFRNIGAYGKLGCHRPNKLDKAFRDKVRWVNGSGRDMTDEALDNGWRNSKRSIGYDLLQLNHYALRSAESFLIKRQRGRALHVDRSIGLNYWVRMDWCDVRDITIKRNIPRLRAELARLMQDNALRRWHQHGLDWHRAKAQSLYSVAEFAELFQQTRGIALNATERAAYALTLDMES